MDFVERSALAVAAVATAAFGAYGLATGAPSTAAYVVTIAAVAVLLVRLRPPQLSPALTCAFAGLAVAHLAGGLVRVDGDALYNAYVGSRVFEYDHLVHTTAVFMGTLALWAFF